MALGMRFLSRATVPHVEVERKKKKTSSRSLRGLLLLLENRWCRFKDYSYIVCLESRRASRLRLHYSSCHVELFWDGFPQFRHCSCCRSDIIWMPIMLYSMYRVMHVLYCTLLYSTLRVRVINVPWRARLLNRFRVSRVCPSRVPSDHSSIATAVSPQNTHA